MTGPATTQQAGSPLSGILWMVASTLCFAALSLNIRVLSGSYPLELLVFFRCAISVVLTFPLAARNGIAGLRTQRVGMHMLRSATSYTGLLLWFYGLGNMPLGDAAALQFTEPLFSVLLAALFLGEPVGRHRWIALAVGFIGALVILRPGFNEVGLPALAVLGCAALFSGTYTCIRVLVRTDATDVIVFYGYFLSLIFSLIPAALVWTTPRLEDIPLILLLAVLSSVSNMCLTRALRSPMAVVMPFSFIRLPAVALLAFLFFSEVPDIWVWIGAVIIFATGYVVARRERRG